MNKFLEEIVKEYRSYASAHGRATSVGDYKEANKSHDMLIASMSKILSNGQKGIGALSELVEDEDDSVACWSAMYLLRFDEEKAAVTLNRLAAKIGPIAFNAEMVLKQWKNGELTFLT